MEAEMPNFKFIICLVTHSAREQGRFMNLTVKELTQ